MDEKEIKNGIIYIATNKKNGMQYVGQTIYELSKRISGHISCTKNINTNSYFTRALRKYGKDLFDWEIIKYPIEVLDEMEIFWIKKLDTFKNGYNLNIGGGSNRGFKHSEETKKLFSKQRKGKKLGLCPEERKIKIRNSKLNVPMKPEHKKNLLKILRSTEVRQKVANSVRGNTSATNRKFKGYYLLFIDPEGKEIKIDNNFNDFCKENNLPKRSVSSFIQGKYKGETVRGWTIQKLLK